jgi:hypothetical protein
VTGKMGFNVMLGGERTIASKILCSVVLSALKSALASERLLQHQTSCGIYPHGGLGP